MISFTSQRLALISLILMFPALCCGASRFTCAPDGPLVQRVKAGGYEVRIERSGQPSADGTERKEYSCNFSVLDKQGKSFYDVRGSVRGPGDGDSLEVFGIDGPDLNGDDIPDLLFQRPGSRSCSETFSIVLLGPSPVVLFDFGLDGGLSVNYEPRQKANVLSLYACWFQYFEDRKLLTVNMPVVRLKIEGTTWRNVSYDFRETYEAHIKVYSARLKTQRNESDFLNLSSTDSLKDYPDTNSTSPEVIAEWESLHATRELVLGIEFEYLYGAGLDAARQYLKEHWPHAEADGVWGEILEIYNKYPPRNVNFARSSRETTLDGKSGAAPPTQSPKSGHAELRNSINCLSTSGCYIRPSALVHLLAPIDAHPRMKCALRLRAAVDSTITNPVTMQWLLSRRDAVRLATSLWGDREKLSNYIGVGKASGFSAAEPAEDFLARIHEQTQALRKELDSPEYSQLLETCKHFPEE